MELNDIEPGIIVRTNVKLNDTRGMMINQRNIRARRPNAIGKLLTWVPGHGGDVWWVRHGRFGWHIAAYSHTEYEPVSLQIKPCASIAPKRLLYRAAGSPYGKSRRAMKRWLRDLQIKRIGQTMFEKPVSEPRFRPGDPVLMKVQEGAFIRGRILAALSRGPRGQIYQVEWFAGAVDAGDKPLDWARNTVVETIAHEDALWIKPSEFAHRDRNPSNEVDHERTTA